jgi:hydroxylysine kinase
MVNSDVLDMPIDEVEVVLRRAYGMDPTHIDVLSGELATVCKVDDAGRTLAFKATPADDGDDATLRWQTTAMQRLSLAGLPVPAVETDVDGHLLHEHVSCGRRALIQVTEWLEDPPLSDVAIDESLLRAVGEVAARVSRGLEGLEAPGPAGHRWELVRSGDSIRAALDDACHPDFAAQAQAGLRVFEEQLAPVLPRLPWTVVHHDLHDANLLIGTAADGDRCITGILDFGDMVLAPRVAELSVAAAYAARNTRHAKAALIEVAEGWANVIPLTPEEASALLPATISRLAVNLAVWASRMSGPRAHYAERRVSGSSQALETLLAVDPASFETRLLDRL